MQTLRRIWALVLKEFLAVLRDPKSRIVVIAPPILQFFIFGYAATFDVSHVRLAVLDECRSAQSREYLAALTSGESFDWVRTLENASQIQEVLENQQARVVVHVGADFDRKRAMGLAAPVQVLADGRNSNVSAVSLGYIQEITNAYNANQIAGIPGGNVTLQDRAWFNANRLSRWYIVTPLAATIAMVVVLLLTSLTVAREREFGTFDQLLVAPFAPWEILVGKAVPGVAFGMLDGLILSAASVLWFGVPLRGSLLALVLLLFVFVLAITGIGLLISSLSTSMQQGLLGAFLFIMPAVILSGFTTPIENMPEWMQVGTLANPLRFAVHGLRKVFLEGAGLQRVWPELWPMGVIALVALPFAGWMFRRRSQ